MKNQFSIEVTFPVFVGHELLNEIIECGGSSNGTLVVAALIRRGRGVALYQLLRQRSIAFVHANWK